jgi:hypothetical protein
VPRRLAVKTSQRSAALFWLLGALTVLCHVAGLFCLVHATGGEAARSVSLLKMQLGLWLAASACWLGALWMLRRVSTISIVGVALLGLCLRLPALAVPVVHSGDVHRYLWDGAVQRAGLDPYAGPPDAPVYAAVRAAQPEIFARINHRHLPTIYPPMAQLVFGLLAAGQCGIDAALLRWKAACGAVEIMLWLVLLALLRREPGDNGETRRWFALWALSPLPAIELWVNGHLDGIGLLLLAGALLFLKRRASVSGALLAAAFLIKPLAAAVVPGLWASRPSRRVILTWVAGAIIAAVLIWVPYRRAGVQVMPSLGEYGRRWRSNDGAHALLQRGAEALVRVAYEPPYYEPWQHKGLARIITGRDRDTVWPDELSNFLSRGASFALLFALLFAGLYFRLSPSRMALLLLSGYALLTPTLHPWYLLWPLLFATLWRSAAAPVLLLCALAPLAYWPLLDEWRGLPHHETVWARLAQHGAAWGAAAISLALFKRRTATEKAISS